jgi:hypothetical protein
MKIISKTIDNTNGKNRHFKWGHLSQTQGRSAKGKRHTRGLHANQCGLKNGTLIECYKKVDYQVQSFITPKPLKYLILTKLRIGRTHHLVVKLWLGATQICDG